MKKILLSAVFILNSFLAIAQQLPNRYIDEITQNLQVTKDIPFSTNIPTVKITNLFGYKFANEETYGEKTVTLKMDIFEPETDDLMTRPVLIFAFGGGFVTGKRNEESIVKLCEAFARRGFVTASIDYRLGMNIGDEELAKRAVYRALQDGRSAVRFFRKNATKYNVDPNQIYISGHSAGAFLAYHTAYLDKESERPASTRDYFGRADLGKLDEIGDNQSFNGKPNGFMGLAGALGALSDIEDPDDIPGLYFHSSDDNIVLFDTGEPFTFLSWIPGVNVTVVSGGNQMNIRANAVNAPHKFYPYSDRGHQVHFDGDEIYPDIISNGARYFHENFLKPATTSIQGDKNICSGCSSQTYSATNTQATYYDWQIEGGVFINRDPSSSVVTVKWDVNATNRNLKVTPYSNYLARGETAFLFEEGNCTWKQTNGRGYDIEAGDGEVYVIGTTEEVHRRTNGGWEKIAGIKASRIDVQAGGYPWAIATNDRIYRNINNQGWERMSKKAREVGASGNHVYTIRKNDRVYKLGEDEKWDEVKGQKAIRIDATSNGDAWVVGKDNFVYQFANGAWTDKKGNFRASDITVSAQTNTVWAIELSTGIPHQYKGNGFWESIDGKLTDITVNSNGQLWGTISSSNEIYTNDCFITESSNTKTNLESTTSNQSKSPLIKDIQPATMSVYPNPADNQVNVVVDGYDGDILKTSIINLAGQQVKGVNAQKLNGQFQIDISTLEKGIYILTIYPEGSTPISKRLLVK